MRFVLHLEAGEEGDGVVGMGLSNIQYPGLKHKHPTDPITTILNTSKHKLNHKMDFKDSNKENQIKPHRTLKNPIDFQ